MTEAVEALEARRALIGARRRLRALAANPVGRAYVAAAAIFVVTALVSPGFARVSQLRFMLINASFIGEVALGQTFVILAGGIDLSVPYVLTGTAMTMTLLSHGQSGALVWAIPLVLAGACVIGLINGVIITFFEVSPIVVTLAMNVMIEGALIALTNGAIGGDTPHALVAFANANGGPIPVTLLIWAVLAVVATLVLLTSSFGRRLYAVGTNPLVSRIAGVRHRSVVISTYVISAFVSGLVGLIIAGYDGQSYLGVGDPYLFASIAAVAVGGASVLGGSGNYLGTIAGTLILAFASALLPIFNLSQGWLQVIYGIVIILTVGVASFEGRKVRA